MGNGSSASNKNGALKETLGDHEERLVIHVKKLVMSQDLFSSEQRDSKKTCIFNQIAPELYFKKNF